MSRGFLKPNIDDDVFKEDKVDIDTQKGKDVFKTCMGR